MPNGKKRIPEAVLTVIEETARKAAAAMSAERNFRPDDCYKQTIKRIKALPVLQERVKDNASRLGENGNLMPGKSKRMQKVM